jgi:DNA-binding transcriptional MerR regulator
MHLKIGEFARLAHVSLKTLHHYDTIGLFQPAHVDKFTSYRYYTLAQLPRLNRILALRDLGFTLEQVQALLDEAVGADELRGMLRLRRAQLAHEIAAAQDKLAQVDIRLRWIEEENQMPQVEVLHKWVPEATVAGARKLAQAADNMRDHCIALDRQVCRFMQDAALSCRRQLTGWNRRGDGLHNQSARGFAVARSRCQCTHLGGGAGGIRHLPWQLR